MKHIDGIGKAVNYLKNESKFMETKYITRDFLLSHRFNSYVFGDEESRYNSRKSWQVILSDIVLYSETELQKFFINYYNIKKIKDGFTKDGVEITTGYVSMPYDDTPISFLYNPFPYISPIDVFLKNLGFETNHRGCSKNRNDYELLYFNKDWGMHVEIKSNYFHDSYFYMKFRIRSTDLLYEWEGNLNFDVFMLCISEFLEFEDSEPEYKRITRDFKTFMLLNEENLASA